MYNRVDVLMYVLATGILVTLFLRLTSTASPPSEKPVLEHELPVLSMHRRTLFALLTLQRVEVRESGCRKMVLALERWLITTRRATRAI